MKISSHVDYLALTFLKERPNLRELFARKAELYEPSTATARPLQGYTRAASLLSGVLVLSGEERMGTHIICSGSALQKCRDASLADRTITLLALKMDAKVTRIDVAIDLVGCRMTPTTVKRAWKAKQIHTRAKQARQWEDLSAPGHTVYIGSPDSDRIGRFYDKNADLGIESKEKWTRMELQNRDRWARATAQAIADTQETITVAAGAFAKFMQWDNAEYNEVLNRTKSDIAPEQPREHDTLSWLTDAVAPAFARYESEHPQINVMAVFLQALADERLALEHSNETPF